MVFYELMVLSLLMQSPFHAYLIAKIFNDTMGPWEKVSKGSLSQLMNKLERKEMIEVASPSEVPYPTDGRSRVYKITPRGQDRFIQLMMDTQTNLGSYQKVFRIKSLHLEFLNQKQQLFLIDHYVHYCQAAIQHVEAELLEFDHVETHELSGKQFYIRVRELLQHQMEQWQHEIVWVERLRKEVINSNN